MDTAKLRMQGLRLGDIRRLEDQSSNNYGDDQNVFNFLEETYGNTQFQDDGYNRIQVNPNQNVQFRSCVTIETENYNLLLDNLEEYTRDGVLTSIRDYVLFDLCSSGECNNDENVFEIDLETFIGATIYQGPENREKICEACLTYEDTCQSERGGVRRQLDQRTDSNCTYVLFDEEACNKCGEYDCWNDDQDDYESIDNWVSQYAECSELHYQWNNLDLYGRWTCNEQGTGVEMGVFIDPYCTMQQTQLQFSNFVQDSGYIDESQGVLDMVFQGKISCRDDDWYFLDYDSYMEIVQNGDQCEAYEDEISEACGGLFYGDYVPRRASDCGSAQNIANILASNGNEDYEEYETARKMLYEESLDWYTYDITALQAYDGASTCEAVRVKYNRAVRAMYMSRGKLEKWIPLIAGLAIAVLLALRGQMSRNSKIVNEPASDDSYVEAKEETLKKISRSQQREDVGSEWASQQYKGPKRVERLERPHPRRSLGTKKSHSLLVH
eukprot:scaffold333_cov133-Cylindrotheca_fusiformis.AAC.32